jgi:hypothetical protein
MCPTPSTTRGWKRQGRIVHPWPATMREYRGRAHRVKTGTPSADSREDSSNDDLDEPVRIRDKLTGQAIEPAES